MARPTHEKKPESKRQIPLYKDHKDHQDLKQMHFGLLFDKFYEWKELGRPLKEQDKSGFLEKFQGYQGNGKTLEETRQRQIALIESLGGTCKVFKNEWHFVTGMGIDHPLENGLAWHPTLGLPYLAGSGVKGLVRSYCEQWLEWEKEKITQIFGSDDTKKPRAGEFIFFDAIPVKPVELTADVMTPHIGKWYEEGGKDSETDGSNVPADWHTPVPITFLAVKSCSLLFGIAPRAKKENNEALKELFEALQQALEWLGAGAKTAAGYGHFVEDKKASKAIDEAKMQREQAAQEAKEKAEFEIKLAALSPLEQVFLRLNNDPVTLVKALESGEFEGNEKEAAEKIKELMGNKWNPQGNPEKDKNAKRSLVISKYISKD